MKKITIYTFLVFFNVFYNIIVIWSFYQNNTTNSKIYFVLLCYLKKKLKHLCNLTLLNNLCVYLKPLKLEFYLKKTIKDCLKLLSYYFL